MQAMLFFQTFCIIGYHIAPTIFRFVNASWSMHVCLSLFWYVRLLRRSSPHPFFAMTILYIKALLQSCSKDYGKSIPWKELNVTLGSDLFWQAICFWDPITSLFIQSHMAFWYSVDFASGFICKNYLDWYHTSLCGSG